MSHGDKSTLTFPGDRSHGVVAGLTPFLEYSLIVMTFKGRGTGPGSHPVNFKTPEGGEAVRGRWGRGVGESERREKPHAAY